MTTTKPSLLPRCLAELLGTFILVFFGCGAVHAAVLTGSLSGMWQVAVVWGMAIMTAAFVLGGLSGAHFNPAITFAQAVWRRFGWWDVAPYMVSQLLGAFAAAAVLFALYGPFLADKERELGVIRGMPGSEITAMCYCAYFPNPALSRPQIAQEATRSLHEVAAMAAEAIGTSILALIVFALTDPRNTNSQVTRLAPFFVGMTLAMLISVIAPLTQAGLNPARDLGPRCFAYLAGWGEIALPGPRATGFVTVYILAPLVGGMVGGGVYHRIISPRFVCQPASSGAGSNKSAPANALSSESPHD